MSLPHDPRISRLLGGNNELQDGPFLAQILQVEALRIGPYCRRLNPVDN